MKIRYLLAAVAAAAVVVPALAQPAGTLKKIAEARSIALGFRLDAAPFSYRGSNGEPTGYSVDLCRRVVTAIERALNVTNLEVKWVPVTPENRIAAVTGGAVDLECGVTTVTLGRQEQGAGRILHVHQVASSSRPDLSSLGSTAEISSFKSCQSRSKNSEKRGWAWMRKTSRGRGSGTG